MVLKRENKRKEERVGIRAGGTKRKRWGCSARTRKKKEGSLIGLGQTEKRVGLRMGVQAEESVVVEVQEAENRIKIGRSGWGHTKKGLVLKPENKKKRVWLPAVGTQRKGSVEAQEQKKRMLGHA